MWLAKIIYQEMREALVATQAQRDILQGHNRALETTMDWLRVRVSQLEHERAIMLSKYMGIDVPVQVIERAREKKAESPYHTIPHFDDLGDEQARKLGITWNADGSVSYGGTPDIS